MNWFKLDKIKGPIKTHITKQTPFKRQNFSFSCAGATLFNLYLLLNKNPPKEIDINKDIHTNPEFGTNPKKIITYLKNNNIEFEMFDKNDNLERILDNNKIVICEYQDYVNSIEDLIEKTSSHFAIIAGYDDSCFYVIDSFAPLEFNTKSTIKKINKNKFLKNWKARDFKSTKIIDKFGIIIDLAY